MQPDSLIPDYTNPQAWNRYSYVGNNPVNFNDPTGHYACGDGEEKECGTGKTQGPNKNPHSNWSPAKKGGGGDNDKNNDGDENCKGLNCLHNRDDDDIILSTVGPITLVSSSKNCSDCGIEVFEGFLHIGEGGVLFGVSVIASIEVLAVGPEGLIAWPFFMASGAVGLDFVMFGVQEIAYGMTDGTGKKPDPIPLIHLFFPDYLKR